MNILVIEDDRRLADLIERRLRTAGHATETCDDGSAGLERASAGDLDLAIVDVMLPGMDGSRSPGRSAPEGSRCPS